MRVNIYAEEMTNKVEIISKEIDGHAFTGVRFYLHLPVSVPKGWKLVPNDDKAPPLSIDDFNDDSVRGPFIHREGDDDSAAVTFWGKRDLRVVLRRALELLDEHYKTTAKIDASTVRIGDKVRGRSTDHVGEVIGIEPSGFRVRFGSETVLLHPHLHLKPIDGAEFVGPWFDAQ